MPEDGRMGFNSAFKKLKFEVLWNETPRGVDRQIGTKIADKNPGAQSNGRTGYSAAVRQSHTVPHVHTVLQ